MPNRATLQEIERRLMATLPSDAQMLAGDHAFQSDWVDPGEKQALRDAAVLVPIVDRPTGLTVVLTKRADHLNAHAGQVAFPGGRIEDSDGSAEAAALRETEEEIGLSRDFITIKGELERYRTGTGFSIQPIVGFVEPGFKLDVHAGEVAEVFEVPFDFLMDPENHLRHSAVWQGKRREYYAMPYGDYYIWGATAGMLVNFYKRVYG